MVTTQSGQLSSLIDIRDWKKLYKQEDGHPLTQSKMPNSIEMSCHPDEKRQNQQRINYLGVHLIFLGMHNSI